MVFLVLVAHAQPAPKVLRVGVVYNAILLEDLKGETPRDPNAEAFQKSLESYGWVRGRNVEILWRSAEGQYSRLPSLIDGLVKEPVDVLVLNSNGMTKIGMAKTREIPIVMSASHRVVEDGIVQSLARPGGNVTGVSASAGIEVHGKRLALLKQAVPSASSVAILGYGAVSPGFNEEMSAAAKATGVQLVFAVLSGSDWRIEEAIDDAIKRGAKAMYVLDLSVLNQRQNRKLIQSAAIRHRLPVIYGAAWGGDLLSYAEDMGVGPRRAAYYVDRILRGAKPGELPIEQPTEFRLTIDLRAAEAIGLKIQPSLLLQADQVVR